MNLQPLLRTFGAIVVSTGFLACSVTTADNFQNPPAGPPVTCVTDVTVTGCGSGVVGYTCTNPNSSTTCTTPLDRPDDGDVNLVCSGGTTSSDGCSAAYCCVPYAQQFSLCTPNPTLTGCTGNSIGFSCTGESAPSDADTALTCTPGPSSGGATTFCCQAS